MLPAEIETSLETATQHHLAGRLTQAEPIYREIIAAHPEHPDAFHRLGVLTWQTGNPQAAAELIGRAIQINPRESRYYASRGQVLAAMNVIPSAIAEFQRAIELKPSSIEALFGLGRALQQTGRSEQAIPVYRQAIDVSPDHVESHLNLGNVLHSLGRFNEAAAAYQRAMEVQPDLIEAISNLGAALQGAGKIDEAIEWFNHGLKIRADFAPLYNNLGNALAAKKQLDEAEAILRKAVSLQPEFADGWYNLANVLRDKTQFNEAIEFYRKATELRPSSIDAFVNLGNVLQSLGQFSEAAKAYLSALAIRPENVAAHNNLSNTLRTMGQADEAIRILHQALALRPDFNVAYCNLGNVLKDVGRLDEALECFRRAVELKRDDSISHSNLAYSVCFHPDYDGPAILRENLRFNVLHAQRFSREIRPHENDRDPHRRLRIGYVSPDFRRHCQSLFTIPLLSRHDHEQFEIFCYANVPNPDEQTERIKSYADQWRPTNGVSDAKAAEMIRADKIDVLVDLTMHMSNARPLLLARKPAPVQIAWLAYPGTTGLSAMDYRLTDPWLDPPGVTDCNYSERSIRLPDTFWCYDPLATEPEPGELPALTNGFLTFGCLNNFCKVNDATLATWGKCLSQVAHSRLLLLCPAGSHRQRVLVVLGRAGIEPDRIEFAEYRPRDEYLKLYRRIDLGLDTFPYNGHTTSLDSYWMGVPVITRIGTTCVGRAGLSQLQNLDLTELAANTDEEFVRLAVTLARDLPRLSALRTTLRNRLTQSPLMDGIRFARNVESIYRQTFRDWCTSNR